MPSDPQPVPSSDFKDRHASSSSLAETLYRNGQNALNSERAAEALDWLDQALRAAPGMAAAHVDRGRALNRLGRRMEAIQALCRAVAIDPDENAALKRLCWLLEDDRLRTSSALARIGARGLPIRSVIDVGASDGHWSLPVRSVWPEARFHLVEAFEHWRPALEALSAQNPTFSHVIAAAGERDGEVWFSNDPAFPYGGAANHEAFEGAWRAPQIALSLEAARAGLEPPYLIKLDTHGFEIPILEGAAELLPNTNLVVIEVYTFHVHPEARLFPDICRYMAERGFRTIDLSEPLWREHDNALWQFDLFFIRADSPEFLVNQY